MDRPKAGRAVDGSLRSWLLADRRLGHAGRDLRFLVGLAALAFAARIAPVLAGGGLTGLHGYDDGVYLGTSIAITKGALPYRDFLLLHPPGEPVFGLPFAILGSIAGDDVGFALARLATMWLGVLNTVLVALVAGRHRRLAGVLAGTFYATWTVATRTEHTTDLHAVQTTLVLLALLALVQPGRIGARRAGLAGAAIGLAASVQLWQGLTAAILLWWVVTRSRSRPRPPWRTLVPGAAFGASAAAAFVLVCLPFFAAAPEAMFRMALLDQLARPRLGVSLIERLRSIEGLPQPGQLPPGLRPFMPDALVIAAAVVIVLLVVATATRFPWTRPWALLAVAQGAFVLATPSFYFHYAAFGGPALVLVLGTGAAAIVGAGVRQRPVRVPVVGLVTAIMVASAVIGIAHAEGDPLETAALRADVTDARCVASDFPALLVLTGALRSDLANGCRLVLDPAGTSYDSDRGRLRDGTAKGLLRQEPGYQAAMRAWYGDADVALMIHRDHGLTPATEAFIEARLPVVRTRGIVRVLAARP